MKALLVIADGMGDRPISELNNLTPLEYAYTPTLDKLTAAGCTGLIHPYKPGCRVGTDWGHLCIFGNDPAAFYTGRGSIEATSAGFTLQPGDIALRGNFATVDENLVVHDRRAGRINDKTSINQLIAAVDGMVIDDCTFYLKGLTEHRLAIIMRGPNLDGNIPDTDPGTAKEGQPIHNPQLTCSANAQKTASLLWRYLYEVNTIWNNHPVNLERQQHQQPIANMIITRGSGAAMVPVTMTSRYPNLVGACIAGDITVVGIAQMCGLDGYYRPEFTGSFDTDYLSKAQLAVELLNKYNFVVVHVKATDLCGHDNLPQQKVAVLQHIDQMFAYWQQHVDLDQTYFAMTADHSTPCHMREHSADPVPSFLSGPHIRRDDVQTFGERTCSQGILNNYTAAQFTATIMDYIDCSPKFGA